MPKGVYRRKNGTVGRVRSTAVTTNSQTVKTNGQRPGTVVYNSAEPAVPTVHIRRGADQGLQYGVQAYGLTTAQAREDATREFMLLEATIQEIKSRGINVK